MWIVIAKCFGDGETYAGNRIWSQEFRSREAAKQAAEFLKSDYIAVAVLFDEHR